jgi:hypothetical protein
MDHLPHLLEVFVHLRFSLFQALLAEVNGIGEQPATGADAMRITAFLQLNATGFEEVAQVLEEFVFVNRFHIWSNFLPPQ